MKYAIVLFMLIGCGRYEPVDHQNKRSPVFPCHGIPETDEEALPYVEAFYAKAREYNTNCYLVDSVKVTDDDLEVDGSKGVIGICTVNKTSRKIIIERRMFGKKRSVVLAKSIVFHELGHCALDLDHSEQEHINLMTPIIISIKQAEENWELLERKLFNRDLSLFNDSAE